VNGNEVNVEWVGMVIGMISREWEQMGTIKVISAHLYLLSHRETEHSNYIYRVQQ